MRIFYVFIFMMSFICLSANAQTSLKIYGPGGPAPALKKCALAYEKAKNIKVDITSGPTETWIAEVKNADIFYSGSENMMDFFIENIKELNKDSVETHYLRPSAILVRAGNPKKIKGIKDLTERDLKVLVVNGAGQVGMWEDIIGRMQNIKAINKFRSNIVLSAKNTGLAEKKWKEDKTIDAWLVFNIWGMRNKEIADIIPTESELTIYRSMGTAIAQSTSQKKIANEFIKFMSQECREIFNKEGWK